MDVKPEPQREERAEGWRRLLVVLSIILAVVASIGGLLQQVTGISGQPLIIGVLTVAWLLTLGFYAHDIWENKIEADFARTQFTVIAFLSPSPVLGDHSFYRTMLFELQDLARRKNASTQTAYMIYPFWPEKAFDEWELKNQVERIEKEVHDIDGVIFIPNRPDDNVLMLTNFEEEKKTPLLLVDVNFNPDPDSHDDRLRGNFPHFVGGNEELGGQLAAQIMETALGRRKAPRVLVVTGGKTAWEKQRSTEFKKAFEAFYLDAEIDTLGPFDYDRMLAGVKVKEYITGLPTEGSGAVVRLDGVFACNDDMALGIRDALEDAVESGECVFHQTPQIVGYDGIREMKRIIERSDDYIAGTVDVKIADQAEHVFDAITKLIKGTGKKELHRQYLVPPTKLERTPKAKSKTVKPSEIAGGGGTVAGH